MAFSTFPANYSFDFLDSSVNSPLNCSSSYSLYCIFHFIIHPSKDGSFWDRKFLEKISHLPQFIPSRTQMTHEKI